MTLMVLRAIHSSSRCKLAGGALRRSPANIAGFILTFSLSAHRSLEKDRRCNGAASFSFTPIYGLSFLKELQQRQDHDRLKTQ